VAHAKDFVKIHLGPQYLKITQFVQFRSL
jgi:hypothetical protein